MIALIAVIDMSAESVAKHWAAPMRWAGRAVHIAAVSNPSRWLAHMEARHGKAVARVGCADIALLMARRLGRPIEIGRSHQRIPINGILLVASLSRSAVVLGCASGCERSAALQWFAVSIKPWAVEPDLAGAPTAACSAQMPLRPQARSATTSGAS